MPNIISPLFSEIICSLISNFLNLQGVILSNYMKHSDKVNKLESLAEDYLLLKHMSFYGHEKQLHPSRRRPQADLKKQKKQTLVVMPLTSLIWWESH